ncbi:DNA replication/repair protein RecF [Pelotalea chapellei]|uniref:DNA replication and repair protein RecF n=1 Tax=Pelotalea chapellei TaxID=44671 RepID=A0ABS5U4Y6_9BACT|nr:DNA replication/repair protein RecF [Pelotalea chapellei]MBT1070709.1 DNA replication/repair protein RecF [Pelotalea chapellei]
MYLRYLAIVGFRNLEAVRIEPGRRFNLFYGLNGQGKTNLLEAVYLLGNTRSFRSARLPEYIRHGQPQARIQGDIASAGIHNSIKATLEPGGRRVELDGKALHRASDLHGKLNAVVFSPDDAGMIRSGPEARRRYLDRAVYQSDIGYLHCWHGYQRILKQRNHLLKSADKSGLEIWTEQLAQMGAEVIERRLQFVYQLNDIMQRHYATISGGCETAGIAYRPEGIQGVRREEIFPQLLDLFDRHSRSDERFGTTTAGPHRDDVQFFLDGRPLKAFGSQGQQKSFILALKMAEMENLQSTFEEPPLLLLDDMSSELDSCRHANLVDFLTSRDVQVFMTTTERSPALLGHAAAHCSIFHVQGGNLTFEGNESHE